MRIRLILLTLAFFPYGTLAASGAVPAQVSSFMGKVYAEIVNPIITVMFAVAILYLSWSVFQYTFQADKLEKDKLKSSLIYGVVGVFIMSTVFAIMKFVAASVGADPEEAVMSI